MYRGSCGKAKFLGDFCTGQHGLWEQLWTLLLGSEAMEYLLSIPR